MKCRTSSLTTADDLGVRDVLGVVEVSERWLDGCPGEPGSLEAGLLAGKRVLVSTDGGRCRMRIPAPCGRRRKKSRHRGYKTPWQEPRLLVIHVLDSKGRLAQEYRPVYDGTMGNCEALLTMLARYLKALGAHEAKELIVAADGTKWFWDGIAHVGYFSRNADRMQYADFRRRRVPLGSGAMESAVRRIVNLRMRSNAKFWLQQNAEAMLMMRSYLKAGRFDDLVDWTFAAAAPSWNGTVRARASGPAPCGGRAGAPANDNVRHQTLSHAA